MINSSKLVEENSQVSEASGTGSSLSDRDEDVLGDVSNMIEENQSSKSITGAIDLPEVEDPIEKDNSSGSDIELSTKVESGISKIDDSQNVVSQISSSQSVRTETGSQQSGTPVQMGSDTSDLDKKSVASLDQESQDQSVIESSMRSGISENENTSQSQQSSLKIEQDSTVAEISEQSRVSEFQSDKTPDVSPKDVISEFGVNSNEIDQSFVKSAVSTSERSGSPLSEHTQSVKSGDSIKQIMTDEDALQESLDDLSKKEDNLEDQLDQLEQMSNVGQLDEEDSQEQKSVISSMSTKSSTISPLTMDKQSETLSTTSVDIQETEEKSAIEFESGSHQSSPVSSTVNIEEVEHKSVGTSEQFSEPIVGMDRSHFSEASEKDIETVMTDENDKPLTEKDKEIILDELEGKSVKADLHINHKSIESLHHINVYHYLPPKFIQAGSMPYGYPGMPQQQQPMTPGPIINIHNSTTSSGGGSNNAYDVGPDGKLHSMGSATSGPVVVNNPTPSQNWGQVVYSNNHHGVHSGAVSTVSQQTTSQIQNQETPVMNNMVSQPIETNVKQTPLTIESMSPNVVNETPIISAQDIKVEPIVNSDVINKSPITNNLDEKSQQSAFKSEISSAMSMDQESFINQSEGNLNQLDDGQDTTSQPVFESPSERSDFDEETVFVDPDKVNDKEGQSVVLGGDESENILDNKSNIII